jgi:hypothetical protein
MQPMDSKREYGTKNTQKKAFFAAALISAQLSDQAAGRAATDGDQCGDGCGAADTRYDADDVAQACGPAWCVFCAVTWADSGSEREQPWGQQQSDDQGEQL